jgi:hypothetical protein
VYDTCWQRVLQASLHVVGFQLQRLTYDDFARTNTEILTRIQQLGGAEVWLQCRERELPPPLLSVMH